MFRLALQNIKRRPFRSVMTALLAGVLSAAVFSGGFVMMSLQNGLDGYRARLGADIIVIPNSAKGHGSVDDILLQGITGAYYMSARDVERIAETEGIAAVTSQYFLTSAKASCCSVRVQIIGFDPQTDFSVMPWISDSIDGDIGDGDVLIGAKVSMPADGYVTFYGERYRVAAQLGQTGTGLDSAVFANMATVGDMAKNAKMKNVGGDFSTSEGAASAVLIKVEDGSDIQAVADDINIHITKVRATAARSMVSDIAEGLRGVSRMIGIFTAAVLVMAAAVLTAVFALLSNERRREFAILRVMGASQRLLFTVMSAESVILSLIGAVLGTAVCAAVVLPLRDSMKAALGLPFLSPSAGMMALLITGAVCLSVLAGVITAFIFARKITKSEAGLLIRE